MDTQEKLDRLEINYDYLKEENEKLKKENKKLKEKISEITMVSDDEKQSIEHILELEEENKKLNKKIEKLQIEIGGLMGERDGLQMVVERLHKELEECECSMHFENDEVGYRKRECKKLKAELSKYKKQYEHSMGEDDELIYEEGLYD